MGLNRRTLIAAGALALLALGLVAAVRRGAAPGPWLTTAADRGDVAVTVAATGTVQAVTTVQVGSQVSGTISALAADFNGLVKRGQVLARLDPSLFEARMQQAKANLATSQANVQKAQAALTDARQKYERAKELASQQLMAQADLDAAESTWRGATAQLRAAESDVGQSAASLHQAEVDLEHTVIGSPIDGVVVARNVDVGQTVAASLQAPVLFVIANDLSRLQVKASVDEADVGRVAEGQPVSFHVDAYPEQVFGGKVTQVRLQPTTVQNVVTYDVIIDVDNPGRRLMPGMTATVSIEVARHDGVVRVPAAALRYRPPTDRVEPAAGGGEPSPGETREARSARGPAGPGGPGRPPGSRRSPGGPGGAEAGTTGGPRPATLWQVAPDGRARALRVLAGLSDGNFTEIVRGLDEGQPVITGIAATSTSAPAASAAPGTNPFAPGPPQRRTR